MAAIFGNLFYHEDTGADKAIFFFSFFFLAVLVFLAVRSLFSSCSEQGLLFIAVCSLLIVVASLVADHGL